MSEFVSASPPSGGIEWEDHNGKLLVIEPLTVETGIKTSFGEKDAVRGNVHVLTGPTESEDYPDCLVFPKLLIGQLRGNLGSKVVGRLEQGVAKPGQKPPWRLAEATEDDLAKASAWLKARTSSSLKSAAPF